MNKSIPHIGIYDSLNDSFSGITRYVLSLVAGLDRSEFRVTLFCRHDGPYKDLSGVERIFLPGRSVKDSRADPQLTLATRPVVWVRDCWRQHSPRGLKLWTGFGRDSKALVAFLRAHRTDLFHAQLVGADVAPLAARKAGCRAIVGTFHIDTQRSHFAERILETITNHSLDIGIAVSEQTKKEWVRSTFLPEGRVTVIPNAVDPSRFRRRLSREAARRSLGLPVEGRIVGSVGRLAAQKGYEYLIQAIALLAPEYPDLTLVIAGEGTLREQLCHQASLLHIADRTRLLGHLDDVQPVLDAIDIFALSSLWEAMPFSLLEAMASGLPVVGTSVAGVSELVVPDHTGYLVPPKDPVAMSSALRILLNSPELRKKFAHASQQRVIDRFNLTEMVKKTIELYRTLLANKHSRGMPLQIL